MTKTLDEAVTGPAAWMRHPIASLRTELGGEAAAPALLFAALNAFDELDAAAFALFGPEIVDDFNISAGTFGLVSLPVLVLGMVLPLLAGQATDRFNRVWLAVGGGLVWFGAAVATGIVQALWLFVVVRALTSVGKSVAGPTHTSLMSDYYPVRGRGLAFSFHANSQAMGQFLGAVLAAWIAVTWDWRVSFIVLPIPGLLAILMMTRLREPERGAHERLEVGEEHFVEPEPLPMRESLALLSNIKSWRTYAIVWLFLAAGLAMSSVLPFYLSATFGVSVFGRGWILGALALLSGIGAVLGGVLGQRAMKRDDYSAVARLVTLSMLVSGVALFALAAAPTLPFALLVMLFTTPLRAMAAVPVTLVLSATVPVRIRGQGFGAIWVFFSVGLLLVPISLQYGDMYSFRVSLLLGVVPMLIGAAFAHSARGRIGSDIHRVNRLGSVEMQMRRRREAGEPIHLLEVVDLDVSYGTVQVLFDVNLHVEQGETVALLGTNGAGKSTLLRAASGLIRPTDGLVLFDGEDITGLPAETVTERGIIQVPGGRGVFPGLSVERNLRLGSYLYRKDEQQVAASLEEVLDLFPRLGERLGQQAGTMSGGEQQMLAIAQAFMAQPKLLVVDELSLGLAPAVVQDLLGVVERINKAGMTVLLVEQSLNIALELADRAYFMEKGEVRFEGPARELLERGDIVRSVFLEAGGRA